MIHVCEPAIGKEEIENVMDALKSNEISGSFGKYIDQFENDFSRYCGVKHGIATTSGTTALHLALASLGIKEEDEVILPALTNIATAFAVVYCGARPVVVDSERDTWNMNTDLIEEKITKRTKVILPVHIYGHPVDMNPISDLAKRHRLLVVEDVAEAHGAEYFGKKVGGLGNIGCFSFYANKIIVTGEGGMVVTNNEKIADQARLLRNLAFSKEQRFRHHFIGFNYRMTNVQAAIGVAQLNKIDEIIERKRKIAHSYNALLREIPGIVLPPEKSWAKNVYWMYSILIEEEFGLERDHLIKKLAESGIETRTFFIPMNQQPIFREMGLFENEGCPVAEELSRKGLYLPSSVALTESQVGFIVETIKKIRG